MFYQFPRLKICFAHGGGSFPYTVGRIQHGYNVRPDLCATACSTPPRSYLGKFWCDSLVHDPDALKLLVKVNFNLSKHVDFVVVCFSFS